MTFTSRRSARSSNPHGWRFRLRLRNSGWCSRWPAARTTSRAGAPSDGDERLARERLALLIDVPVESALVHLLTRRAAPLVGRCACARSARSGGHRDRSDRPRRVLRMACRRRPRMLLPPLSARATVVPPSTAVVLWGDSQGGCWWAVGSPSTPPLSRGLSRRSGEQVWGRA